MKLPRRQTSGGTVLLASLSVAQLAAQQGPDNLLVKDTVFRAATPVGAEVGYLRVPEDRERLGSPAIRIRFLWFPTLAEDPGPPIFWLSGGPGVAGVEDARFQAFPLMMALRAVSDVVVIDQRGTSGSHPHLQCPERWSYPLEEVGTWGTLIASAQESVRECAAHWRNQGVDLAAYHTSANADDIDDLRQALGLDQVDLFGVSYGTHLGLEILRRHPGGVRKAIFVGIHGHDQTVGRPRVADRQITKLDRLFRADSSASTKLSNLRETIRAVVERLEREPITAHIPAGGRNGDSTTVRIGPFDFQLAVSQRLGHRSNVTHWLVRTLRDAAAGDFTRAAWAVMGDRSRRFNAMALAMGCASGASESRLARIQEENRRSLLGRAPAFPYLELCDAIPHTNLGPEFRTPARSRVPIFFVSGTLDHDAVRTVESLKRQLPNAQHLVLENGFHNDYIDYWPIYFGQVRSFLSGEHVGGSRLRLPIEFRF